jgi:hypothetical protein
VRGIAIYLVTGIAGMGAVEAGLRGYYNAVDHGIEVQAQRRLAAGEDEERVARWAVSARNAAKSEVRHMDLDVVRMLAEDRNREKYGDPVGPTFEQLRKAHEARVVIREAGMTDARVNAEAAISGLLLLVVLGLCLRAVLRGPGGRPLAGAAAAVVGCWILGKSLGFLGALSGSLLLTGLGVLAGVLLGAFGASAVARSGRKPA